MYLKIKDIARRLDISEQTVRRAIKAGKIKAVVISKSYRVHISELKKMVVKK